MSAPNMEEASGGAYAMHQPVVTQDVFVENISIPLDVSLAIRQ